MKVCCIYDTILLELLKSYYYDSDTCWYRLTSRYYDAAVGRFINADGAIAGVGNIQGYNLFSYCFNNPVNMTDPSGHWPKWIKNVVSTVTNAVKKAATAVANAVVSFATPNRRPNKGKPGSTYKAPNGDRRTYGPDGRPHHDYNHDDHGQPDLRPHDENGGHNHDWDWSRERPREEAYVFDWKPIAGVALVTVCAVGIIAVADDDATGIGVADDFLFGPLGSGVGEGLILIFR